MRYLLILIVFLSAPAWADYSRAKPQTLTFETAIDGTSFMASGRKISLWGVKAIPPASRYAWASRLYLQSTLSKGVLVCRDLGRAAGQPVMHCTIDHADIGSLLVQMGMVVAEGPYYQGEETTARSHLRGVWKSAGKPL